MWEPLTGWRVDVRHVMIGTGVFWRLSNQILFVKGLSSRTVPQPHAILIILHSLSVIASVIPLLIPIFSIHELLLPVQNRLKWALLRLRPLAPWFCWLQLYTLCFLPISLVLLLVKIDLSSRTVHRVHCVAVAVVITGQLFLVFLEFPQEVLVWCLQRVGLSLALFMLLLLIWFPYKVRLLLCAIFHQVWIGLHMFNCPLLVLCWRRLKRILLVSVFMDQPVHIIVMGLIFLVDCPGSVLPHSWFPHVNRFP